MENRELLKLELKKEVDNYLDKFIDDMGNGFTGESFDIKDIEVIIGKAIDGCKNSILLSAEKVINTNCEKEIISKKKDVYQKWVMRLKTKGKEKWTLC